MDLLHSISPRPPLLTLLTSALAFTLSLHAQDKEPPKERSHKERFAAPKARWEQQERDAEQRLGGNPADAEALADRGEARLRSGRLAEAVEDFRRAAALNPQSSDLQATFAYGLWVQRRVPEALAAARAALALDAGHFTANYYAGLILKQMGDSDGAIAHLERAVKISPDQMDLRFELLNAYRQKGDAQMAGVQFRLMRAVLPPNDTRLLYAEGLLAADAGRTETAVTRFGQALESAPHSVSIRQDLGMALVQSGRWAQATEVLAPLAAGQPQSFTAAYLHALALQNIGRGEEAEKEVRRALALSPDSAAARTLLGIVLATRGAQAEAIAELEAAVARDPRSFDAWFYLGRARYGLRDTAGARDALQRAVAIKPGEAEARFFLATVQEALGEKDAALAEYRALIEQRPQDHRGHVGLGNLLARYGELDAAVAALRRGRELAPQDFEAGLALGRALSRQQKWEEAIRLLREAVARAPESAEAHYQLAQALQRTGQREEAAKEFAIVDRLNQEQRTRSGGMAAPGTNPPPPGRP